MTWREGMAARAGGVHARFCNFSSTINPHKPATRDWYLWQDGWREMDENMRNRSDRELEKPTGCLQ